MDAQDVKQALSVVDNFARYKDVKSILIKGRDNLTSKISIVIPTYKRVKRLKETIQSCLEQVGFDDYVIIISDNNPERNDETEEYIKTLSSDKIIYYKHEENIGMFGNINRCFELSMSEYTVCVHDDDLLLPRFLRIAYMVMVDNKDIDILFPPSIKWNETESEKPEEKNCKNLIVRKVTNLDFYEGNPYPPTGFIAKTKKMIELGGYSLDVYPSNDYYFNVKATEKSGVYTLNLPLYIYRIGINTTLKIETLRGFIERDYFLRKYLYARYPMSKMFSLLKENSYSKSYVGFIKKVHPDYQVDDDSKYLSFPDGLFSRFQIFLEKQVWRVTKKTAKLICVKRVYTNF